jgi:two-component sensor histidine kinase
MTKSITLLLLLFLTSLTDICAQEIILDGKENRFLINQQSNKPRLEVIVQSFTDFEKNVISRSAVMDTLTKPVFEKVTESEYNVKASRVGEKLTFVVRDFNKLPNGYRIKLGQKEVLREGRDPAKYRIVNELSQATTDINFGTTKTRLDLLDVDGQLLYRLNISFSYPRPQLYYVDILAHYNLTNTPDDTVVLRKFTKWLSPEPPRFTEVAGGVPIKVIRHTHELNFGFKPVYYDDEIRPTSVTCKIDNSVWRGTASLVNPYTYVFYHLKKDFDWLNDGKHKLYARYGMEDTNVLEYEFEVKNVLIATIWHWVRNFFWLIFALVYAYPWMLIIILGLIFFANWGNRLKNAREEARKINLELQSIQSQLNPHFVFNALGSIQGLINQNEIESANSYLTDFSKLLRKSLNNNGQEMTPLSEELYVVNNYVKLEKLRFNFQYLLDVAENLETTQVEIPSLLIQPLVENAIKHGISGLGISGILTISFKKEANDLIIIIRDNGAGFDVLIQHSGKGLELTRERIKLLNRKKHKISMTITSGQDSGTYVTLIFKHFC